ncbi:alpha-1,2-galactosyltransferase-like protein [Drechmeria coniospora]|uniref:Alpha-1,2-galactosyltransferase-like protein n=1 Tax=Drechmeria coniospora TaxID=98403 RepID=A0A151GN92_DRECN|nr:alpha-1,2-galactosyltransferase-like protein [Drechmeria coniospora]KYK58462.1 alpha-1,2-galactosyltransferase-like protein [Drechmeria coniospora]ODA83893.1 hypothetical protein RJ55_02409 [Drechmeria coniospora]
MHFAYPPRKNSNPPPFRPRSTRLPLWRRSRSRTFALVLLAFIGAIYLLFGRSKPSPYHERVPSGVPEVVLVTVIDPVSWSDEYVSGVKENREKYGQRHGYEVMVVKASDYDTHGAPKSWAKVMAMRHALTKYPDCKFIWYLDQNAYIMNPTKSLDDVLLEPTKLESLMLKDFPVVPPDSIIKTFAHLRGGNADLILAQDKDGLAHNSVIVRNGEWAKFFLEAWFDPLYRSYNFQKAERHTLEHIVQWHPTILSKLALVPQRIFSAYSHPDSGEVYQQGDFVVLFAGCTHEGEKSCEAMSSQYRQEWRAAFGLQ